MAANEPLCQALGIDPRTFSKEENLILEVELFISLCEELTNFFYLQNQEYFYLIRFELKESSMLEDNFLCFVINDILLTEEYSIEGIAYHIQVPVEIISDVIAEKNTHPSFLLSRKIIELHRSVKPFLYKDIMKKIATKHLVCE